MKNMKNIFLTLLLLLALSSQTNAQTSTHGMTIPDAQCPFVLEEDQQSVMDA
jgi:predicted small lipoprotein YifL